MRTQGVVRFLSDQVEKHVRALTDIGHALAAPHCSAG
jgi:hypothetical protein